MLFGLRRKVTKRMGQQAYFVHAAMLVQHSVRSPTDQTGPGNEQFKTA
jgi:hypothetical protein